MARKGRLTPLYAGLSAAERKRKEREWAYRHLEQMCDDFAALAGGDDTDETEDEQDDSADGMNAFLAELDDGDDDLDYQFNRLLSALERLLGKRQEA
jgi:hypothetical protein